MTDAVPRAWSSCTALVTGGRRGLGRAYADHLRSLGCDVAVTSRTADDALRWDLSAPESTDHLVRSLGDRTPDLLVHAAHAFAPHQPIVALRPDDFTTSLARNVGSTYALLRAIARRMSRHGFGRILVVGSYAAASGGVGQACYIAEKSAYEGLVRSFSAEFASRGVLVNLVRPGIVDTEHTRDDLRPEVIEAYAQRTVTGRLLDPTEVVIASLGLLDPRQCCLTGQRLDITGGIESGAHLSRRS